MYHNGIIIAISGSNLGCQGRVTPVHKRAAEATLVSSLSILFSSPKDGLETNKNEGTKFQHFGQIL